MRDKLRRMDTRFMLVWLSLDSGGSKRGEPS